MPSPRVRVYMGCSFDGCIAGPNHDISWLNQSYASQGDLDPDTNALSFQEFMSQIGCMLMGRSTYDVVEQFGEWHYGETPVLVATRRPLTPMANSIQTVAGSIDELISRAKAAAGEKDVYLDGGDLVRQAMQAELVDEITITFLPVLLGRGIRLFDDLDARTRLQFSNQAVHEGGMLQVTARVQKSGE